MRSMSRAPDRIPPGPIKLTYEDYVDLPDDGRRYEILDGELEVSPAPAPMHQEVSNDSHRRHPRKHHHRAARPGLRRPEPGVDRQQTGNRGSSRSGRRDPLSLVG